MPKDRITMAIIASSKVKPDSRLLRRLVRDMGIPLFLPLGPIPVVFTHAPCGAKDGDGAGRCGLAWNAQEHRAVYQRVSAINESTRCREFHDRWAAGESAKVNGGRVSKIIGCGNIRNGGAEDRILSPTFERYGGRWRRRAEEPDLCDGELVRSYKLYLDLAAMGDGPLARRTQLVEQLVHGRVGLVIRQDGAVVEHRHPQNDGDDGNGDEDLHQGEASLRAVRVRSHSRAPSKLLGRAQPGALIDKQGRLQLTLVGKLFKLKGLGAWRLGCKY